MTGGREQQGAVHCFLKKYTGLTGVPLRLPSSAKISDGVGKREVQKGIGSCTEQEVHAHLLSRLGTQIWKWHDLRFEEPGTRCLETKIVNYTDKLCPACCALLLFWNYYAPECLLKNTENTGSCWLPPHLTGWVWSPLSQIPVCLVWEQVVASATAVAFHWAPGLSVPQHSVQASACFQSLLGIA